jgi:hypothetical protein
VLVLAIGVLWFVRARYMQLVATLYPQLPDGSPLPALLLGVALFVLVSLLNVLIVRRKMLRIWHRKD